jgi:tetratricopeptide (TPR) repeat protein
MFEQVDFSLSSKQGNLPASSTGVIFVQEVPEPARKEYQRGAALIQKDDRTEGIAALKKAIELFPLYFDALELLGTEYVKTQEFELAVPVLTKAVEVNSSAFQSWNSLGVAQYNLKQIDQAVDSMRRAVSLNQKSATANFWMGMLLRQTKKLEQAETYLKQADQLAGAKSADIKWQLALLYNQLQKYAESANELELFLKLQPDSRDREQIEKLIKQLRQKSSGAR